MQSAELPSTILPNLSIYLLFLSRIFLYTYTGFFKEIVVNIKPIFKSRSVDKRTNLHIGVEIRYEANDAEELIHMLEFLKSEEEKRTMGFQVPKAYLSGCAITIAAIMKSLNSFRPGERRINGIVSLHFLDTMRTLYLSYLSLLLEMRQTAEKNLDWDEDHPFYPRHEHYLKIAELYFPPATRMN